MTPREIIKLLEKNNFKVIGQNGSHKKLYNEKNNTTVIVPCHGKALKKGTEQAILKQAKLK